MKLSSQAVGVASQAPTAKMHAQLPQVVTVLYQMGIRAAAAADIIRPPLIRMRSGLAAGIGIVTLYRVVGTAPGPVDTLPITRTTGAHATTLNAEKVRLLERFTGDLSDDNLYLLEYPGGYLLSLNNNFLAFTL